MNGFLGNDILLGEDGNDRLDGGIGNDVMRGGTGDDVYRVDVVGDQVVELVGAGTDTVESSISYALGADVENLVLLGGANLNGTGNALDNAIQGNSGANTLSGLAGNDSILGNDGGDILDGGDGQDTLIGGNGNDLLTGGNGNDILLGGSGQDAFRFISPFGGAGIDTINNFVVADDTIRLLRAPFAVVNPATGNPTNLSLGTLNAGQFRVGANAIDRNDYVIYNPGSGALSFDRDGSGAAGAVQIAQLGLGLPMTNNDISVVA